jgi:hypothetical protein
MWKMRSIFQGGFIAVISTAAHPGELIWRPVGQCRVWPEVFVVVEPDSQLAAWIG